jgi:hypothetical protein
MSLWRVTWLVDVHADTASEAATIAREIQKWSDNTACVFRVTNDPQTAGRLISVSMDDHQASNYHCYVSPLKQDSN